MAKYPTVPIPQFSQSVEVQYRTIISAFDGGNEQRRAKWTAPQYDVTLAYNALPTSHADTLWNFYRARRGAYEAFNFYLGEAEGQTYSWSSEYVATSPGGTTSFTMPCKNSTGWTICINGSALTTAQYAVDTTAGVDDADVLRITTSAPSSGAVITASFTGYPRIRCRFAEDSLSREQFDARLFRMGLKLKGLSPST